MDEHESSLHDSDEEVDFSEEDRWRIVRRLVDDGTEIYVFTEATDFTGSSSSPSAMRRFGIRFQMPYRIASAGVLSSDSSDTDDDQEDTEQNESSTFDENDAETISGEGSFETTDMDENDDYEVEEEEEDGLYDGQSESAHSVPYKFYCRGIDFLVFEKLIQSISKAVTEHHIYDIGKLLRKISTYEEDDYVYGIEKAIRGILQADPHWEPMKPMELYNIMIGPLVKRKIISSVDLKVVQLLLDIVYEPVRECKYEKTKNTDFYKERTHVEYIIPLQIALYEYLQEKCEEEESYFVENFLCSRGIDEKLNSLTDIPDKFVTYPDILRYYKEKYRDLSLIIRGSNRDRFIL